VISVSVFFLPDFSVVGENITRICPKFQLSRWQVGLRYVSIEQTGCDIKITDTSVSEENGFVKTGNVEGHTLHLSGVCLDKNEFIKEIEDILQTEGLYGADVTTNTNNGEGTISGDTIDYKET